MALQKLKISSLKNREASGGPTLTVGANPSSVTTNFNVKVDDNTHTNSYSGTTDFTLHLDGTGVLYEPAMTVDKQVDLLKSICIAYNDKEKVSSYVKLEWGEVFGGIKSGRPKDEKFYKGIVTKLSITYTLFTPDGKPLRAKADLSIEQTIDLNAAGNASGGKLSKDKKEKDLKSQFKSKVKDNYSNAQKNSKKKKKKAKVGLR